MTRARAGCRQLFGNLPEQRIDSAALAGSVSTNCWTLEGWAALAPGGSFKRRRYEQVAAVSFGIDRYLRPRLHRRWRDPCQRPAGSSGSGLLAIALAFGVAVAVAVAAIGHVSGGHINPAVTIALLVTGKIKVGDAISYILAQSVGATVAALALKGLMGPAAAAAGVTSINTHLISVGQCSGSKLSSRFSGAIIFGTAVDMRSQKLPAPFIGLTVVIDILVGGPFTGASMNPARSFGPAHCRPWDSHWVYWVGPIVGGALAGLLYSALFLPRDAAEAQPEVRPDAPSPTR